MEDPVLGEEVNFTLNSKYSRRTSEILRMIYGAFSKVEEAVVETVEEKYVPHIQPPIQPLSWAEVGDVEASQFV